MKATTSTKVGTIAFMGITILTFDLSSCMGEVKEKMKKAIESVSNANTIAKKCPGS